MDLQPINYLSQVVDPFEQAAQGLKLGTDIAKIQQDQAKAQAAQEQAQLAAQEQALFYSNPNPTARDALRFASTMSADRMKAITPLLQDFSKEQQQNGLKQYGQILSALQANPETGIKMLRDSAAAYRNRGDKEEEALFSRIADAAEKPELGGVPAAFKSLVTLTAQLPGAKDMFETIDKAASTARLDAQAPFELKKKIADADEAVAKSVEAIAKASNANEREAALAAQAVALAAKAKVDAEYAERNAIAELKNKAAQLGLSQAQTGSALAQTRKLGVETSKAALELESLKSTGGLDPSKTFDQEEKIRKEYQSRIKNYNELGTIFETLKAASNAKSGVGDISLITQFMKMIDPSSVVRETEFATARDTAGLYDKLKNSLQKANSGQFLQADQRAEFVKLAGEYYKSAQKKANDDKKALGVVVKNYKLNPENVFGQEAATPAPAPTTATPQSVNFAKPSGGATDIRSQADAILRGGK